MDCMCTIHYEIFLILSLSDTYDSIVPPSTKKPEDTPKVAAIDELPGYDVIGNEETKDSKSSSKKFSFSFHGKLGSQRRKSNIEKKEEKKDGGKEGEVVKREQVEYAMVTKTSKKEAGPGQNDAYNTLQHCSESYSASGTHHVPIASKLYPDQYETIGPLEKAGDGKPDQLMPDSSSSGKQIKKSFEDSASSPPPPPLPPPINEDDLPDTAVPPGSQVENLHQSALYYNTVLKGDVSDPVKVYSNKAHLTGQASQPAVGIESNSKENTTSENNVQEDLYMNVSVAKS